MEAVRQPRAASCGSKAGVESRAGNDEGGGELLGAKGLLPNAFLLLLTRFSHTAFQHFSISVFCSAARKRKRARGRAKGRKENKKQKILLQFLITALKSAENFFLQQFAFNYRGREREGEGETALTVCLGVGETVHSAGEEVQWQWQVLKRPLHVVARR